MGSLSSPTPFFSLCLSVSCVSSHHLARCQILSPLLFCIYSVSSTHSFGYLGFFFTTPPTTSNSLSHSHPNFKHCIAQVTGFPLLIAPILIKSSTPHTFLPTAFRGLAHLCPPFFCFVCSPLLACKHSSLVDLFSVSPLCVLSSPSITRTDLLHPSLKPRLPVTRHSSYPPVQTELLQCRLSGIVACPSSHKHTHPPPILRLRFTPALHPLTIAPFSLPLSALPHFIIWYPSPERTPLFPPSPFSVIHWERKNLHAFLVHPFFILRRVPFISSSFLFSLFVIRV